MKHLTFGSLCVGVLLLTPLGHALTIDASLADAGRWDSGFGDAAASTAPDSTVPDVPDPDGSPSQGPNLDPPFTPDPYPINPYTEPEYSAGEPRAPRTPIDDEVATPTASFNSDTASGCTVASHNATTSANAGSILITALLLACARRRRG